MIKNNVLLIMVLVFSFTSSAQISDRMNDASTYYLGARPIAGNIGVYMGLSTQDAEDLLDSTFNESGTPLINLKYYVTDKFVLKGGAKVWKKARSLEGEIDPSQIFQGGSGPTTEYNYKEVEANWHLYFGAEKHFDVSNIFDYYFGAQGVLGYTRQKRNITEDFGGGDYRIDKGTLFGVVYGLEGVIGSNWFIADLPMAFGIEYGFTAISRGGNKFKYEWDETVGGVTTSGTYYESTINDFTNPEANNLANNQKFSELKVTSFDVEPIFRLTYTYYITK